MILDLSIDWLNVGVMVCTAGAITCLTVYIMRQWKDQSLPWDWWNHTDDVEERVWPRKPSGGLAQTIPPAVQIVQEGHNVPVGMWGPR